MVLSWIPRLVATCIGKMLHLGSKFMDQKFRVLRKVTLPVKSVFLSV